MIRPCSSPDYDYWPPRIKPSPVACCTQACVFGPADRSPYAEGRGYIPPDEPIAAYLDGIGTARDWLRGDASADPDLDDAGLAQMDAGGMRGIGLLAMLKGAVGSDQLWGFGV